MELMEMILSKENMEKAIKSVKSNKGAPGVDKMTVNEIDDYFNKHMDEIKTNIMSKKYKPLPVRRVYIPKPNGKERPLESCRCVLPRSFYDSDVVPLCHHKVHCH